ncbi:unnamed protein product [Ceutorhynchus assimilis]|uniref:Uncharacterized protein n=1 Tax=Ceutorhynchus assimilis TaxID=467358 RepID=A0A9N9MPZ7_9CUCU|nr:unnamed protein product [Ceutorhynchus assimilis]
MWLYVVASSILLGVFGDTSKVQDYKCGTYTQNFDFALELRKLAALSFVPSDNVVAAFEELLVSAFYREHEEVLLPVFNYFEDTWIGRCDRKGHRRPPLFTISLWNYFKLVEEDIPRMNNSVEGWYNSFSSVLGAAHPIIWKFINALKKEESLNHLKVEQLIGGYHAPSKRVYKDKAKRIGQIVS